MEITCLKRPSLPNNEIVVPPMTFVLPAPAQSKIVIANMAVRGNSLNKCGIDNHSFQLIKFKKKQEEYYYDDSKFPTFSTNL